MTSDLLMNRVMNVSVFGLDVHSDVFVYVYLQYVHARACASACDYTCEGAFAIACARTRLRVFLQCAHSILSYLTLGCPGSHFVMNHAFMLNSAFSSFIMESFSIDNISVLYS